MIKNDRQYRIVKARAERLAQLAKDLQEKPRGDDAARVELELRAVQSEIARMSFELLDYEGLKSGRGQVGSAESLEDIPRLLIRARIARGLTQADLAESLGLKEQQIQRYEATDYESASLARLKEVAQALDVTLLDGSSTEEPLPSVSKLLGFLESQGLPRDFVKTRLAPTALDAKTNSPISVLSLASRIGRVFGHDVPDFSLAASPGLVSSEPLLVGAFKTGRRSQETKLTAYAAYAHYLALQTLRATPRLPLKPSPDTPATLRSMIAERGGSFEATVSCAWDLGIPVLPLADSGAFHGAYWRHQGRGVVVLKQRHRKVAIWWFDLLHELRHAAEEPNEPDRERIELSPTAQERRQSVEEQAANDFAAEVLFGDVAERLITLVMAKSQGKPALFKRTVELVARRENVDVGALAYYVAHAAQAHGIDWWGTATALQAGDRDPWMICRDEYLARVDLSLLDRMDQELVLRALSDLPDKPADAKAVEA